MKPFKVKSDGRINIYNECIINLVFIFLFCNSFYKSENSYTNMFGWAAVGFICLSLLMTWIDMVPTILTVLYSSIRDCFSPEKKKLPRRRRKGRINKKLSKIGSLNSQANENLNKIQHKSTFGVKTEDKKIAEEYKEKPLESVLQIDVNTIGDISININTIQNESNTPVNKNNIEEQKNVIPDISQRLKIKDMPKKRVSAEELIFTEQLNDVPMETRIKTTYAIEHSEIKNNDIQMDDIKKNTGKKKGKIRKKSHVSKKVNDIPESINIDK